MNLLATPIVNDKTLYIIEEKTEYNCSYGTKPIYASTEKNIVEETCNKLNAEWKDYKSRIRKADEKFRAELLKLDNKEAYQNTVESGSKGADYTAREKKREEIYAKYGIKDKNDVYVHRYMTIEYKIQTLPLLGA